VVEETGGDESDDDDRQMNQCRQMKAMSDEVIVYNALF